MASLCMGDVQVGRQVRRLTAAVTEGPDSLRSVLQRLGDANIAVVDVGLDAPRWTTYS